MRTCANITATIWPATSAPKTIGADRYLAILGCVLVSKQPRSAEGQTLVVNMDHPEVGR